MKGKNILCTPAMCQYVPISYLVFMKRLSKVLIVKRLSTIAHARKSNSVIAVSKFRYYIKANISATSIVAYQSYLAASTNIFYRCLSWVFIAERLVFVLHVICTYCICRYSSLWTHEDGVAPISSSDQSQTGPDRSWPVILKYCFACQLVFT